MAEKTEQPTSKRLREARKKGQIAFSAEVPAAAAFLVGVVVLTWWVPRLASEFKSLLEAATGAGPAAADPLSRARDLGAQAALAGVRAGGPVLLALALAGLAFAVLQAGFHLAPARLAPSLANLSPGKALRRWFSLEGFTEVGKAAFKLAVVLVLGYTTVTAALATVLALHRASLAAFAAVLGEIARSFAVRAALAFAVVAAVDYFLVWRRWKKEMMMSRDEVRREHKEQEGDPFVKGQRRALHQELAATQIAAEVRTADALVVNPTHLAVAVRYDRESMAAPRVAAKGGGEVAQEMLKVAREHEVPIVRNVPLAHALFEVPEGRYIPQDLYEAVAEVLLLAARLRREGGGPSLDEDDG
jgi:flagellar biosynthesis protein FlhB